jgi:hypothetical protein
MSTKGLCGRMARATHVFPNVTLRCWVAFFAATSATTSATPILSGHVASDLAEIDPIGRYSSMTGAPRSLSDLAKNS